MVDHHAIAEILWNKPEIILQKVNSGQTIYALNITFEDIQGLWSVVLLIDDLKAEEINDTIPHVVKISFLFPDQIRDLIYKDMGFVLSEGPSAVIGSGHILEIALDI